MHIVQIIVYSVVVAWGVAVLVYAICIKSAQEQKTFELLSYTMDTLPLSNQDYSKMIAKDNHELISIDDLKFEKIAL